EGPLVTVPHHAGDPFGIDHAAAHDAGDLLRQAADARALGTRMVVVIDRRAAAAQRRCRDRQPTLELIVVVAVEQIVLAVILVVQPAVDRRQPALEQAVLGAPRGTVAIGIAAPGDIGAGEIGGVVPATLIDQRLQSGAVGARLRAEDTI